MDDESGTKYLCIENPMRSLARGGNYVPHADVVYCNDCVYFKTIFCPLVWDIPKTDKERREMNDMLEIMADSQFFCAQGRASDDPNVDERCREWCAGYE